MGGWNLDVILSVLISRLGCLSFYLYRSKYPVLIDDIGIECMLDSCVQEGRRDDFTVGCLRLHDSSL